MLVLLLLAGCTQDTNTPASNTSLNGVDISKYTIVYSQDAPDYCKRAAEYIQQQILERTSINVPVCEASSGTYSHEIIVGNTDRELSKQIESQNRKMEFYMLADKDHIALCADYFIIAAAAYYFVETYIPGATFQSVIPQQVTTATPITKEANNYIFLIGDGMGYFQTLMFEYMSLPQNTFTYDGEYYDGEDVFYGYYLPYQGWIKTNSLSGVTDSAASATAMACGNKTVNGYVGKDSDGNDMQSLTELAVSLEMATAVMSTDDLWGATPAGFFAHAMNRSEGEVIKTDAQAMTDKGTIISCGLNADKNYQDEITKTLTELERNENGFFLMYEEGYIDKHSHDQDINSTFRCLVRFNQAIGLFMEYAFYHPDTFLIITADHETGGLTMEGANSLVYTVTGHTGNDVLIFGYGQGAEIFQNCWMENSEIPKVIAAMWGVENFGQIGE